MNNTQRFGVFCLVFGVVAQVVVYAGVFLAMRLAWPGANVSHGYEIVSGMSPVIAATQLMATAFLLASLLFFRAGNTGDEDGK